MPSVYSKLIPQNSESPRTIHDDKLQIIEPLEDVIVKENAMAIFECKVDGSPYYTCTWHKNGNPIVSSARIRIMSNRTHERLEIDSVIESDHGTYAIVCRNDSCQKSSNANLFIASSDNTKGVLYTNVSPKSCLEIITHLINVKLEVGQEIKLKAKFQSDAVFGFMWYKNNEKLILDPRMLILTSNKFLSLSITPAKITDTGIYYVLTKTKHGISSSYASVQVTDVKESPSDTVTPFIQQHLTEEVHTNEGEDVRIICKIISDLHTNIQWYQNRLPISSNKEIVQDYGCNYIGLKIVKPSTADSAVYSLLLVDELSGAVDSNRCCVLVSPSPMENPPIVTLKKPLDSAIACVGAKVVFDCSFMLTDPEYFYVVWHVGRYKVERTNRYFHVICKGGDFLLYIKKLEPGMAGEVICELRRALTNRKSIFINSTTAWLTVVPPCVLEDNFISDLVMWKEKIYNEVDENSATRIRICDSYFILKDYFVQTLDEASGGEGCPWCIENVTILNITYFRFEEDGIYFLLASGIPGDIFATYFAIYDKPCEGAGQTSPTKIVAFEWSDSAPPTSVWYGIDLGGCDGDFLEVGVSSLPMFEVIDPPVGKIMNFRIRVVEPLTEINVSKVSIERTSEEAPPTAKVCELKPMDEFDSEYTPNGEVIGTGAFGSVSLVQNKNGQYFAAKILKTRIQKKRDSAMREYEIMKSLKHPQLVELIDVFCESKSFAFIMEYLWGGELFDGIVDEDDIMEVDVVPYVRQICEGLEYLHSQKIAHLDLKPENIICLSLNSVQVKIIDFGLAKKLEEDCTVCAMYGTKDYVAPEVLNIDKLTLGCDMWSLGVVTYMLLSGVQPFRGETWEQQSVNITLANYNYDESAFNEMSDLAKNFIDKLLLLKPSERMTASSALKHHWITEGPPKGANAGHMRRARANLKTYLVDYKARWKRAGHMMVAAHRQRSHVQKRSGSESTQAHRVT